MKTKMELCPSDVTKAIKSWVLKETGKEANSVILHVTPTTVGYGLGEHTEYKFTGATVEME